MFKKNIFRYIIMTVFMLSLFVAKAPADIIIVESDDWLANESNYTAIIDDGTVVLIQNCPGILGTC